MTEHGAPVYIADVQIPREVSRNPLQRPWLPVGLPRQVGGAWPAVDYIRNTRTTAAAQRTAVSQGSSNGARTAHAHEA